jgi:hypothetical protein
MRCSAKNGQAKVIYSEKNNSWIDVHDDFKWVDKGKYFTFSDLFIWLSDVEKDGSGILHSATFILNRL